tara:strand:- start:2172 stop:4391 length:2220 start_codon:yes stop_codon:yes gene_type:complete
MTGGQDTPDESIQEVILPRTLVGKGGLDRLMSYTPGNPSVQKSNFEYKDESFGRIFAPDNIGKYSGKIEKICEAIMQSTGVILVYSQYIDGGLVPIALALEERGFIRGGNLKSLFKTPPVETIDAITLTNREDGRPFQAAQYAMITGDKSLSPNNPVEIKRLTDTDNKDGSKIKVVLISQAGSEGLDFKFIRQVHILEPWYNMNRIEQIIGRAVRTCSHKNLPFEERNVELYLYGTVLTDKTIEAADVYVYRKAEHKSVNIGRVSRVLKSCAVDCLLNFEQLGFTVEDMNQTVQQKLSSGKLIDYKVGDRPYTAICDYMESCQYKCTPHKDIPHSDVKDYTYSEAFILMTTEKIIHRIKTLFKERFVYEKDDLVAHINVVKEYPPSQINAALTILIDDKSEYVSDKYGRLGNIVNIDNLYLFQPLELKQPNISTFERMNPIPYKRPNILIENTEATKDNKFKKNIGNVKYTAIKDLLTMMNHRFLTGKEDNLLYDDDDDLWYKFSGIEIMFLEKIGLQRDLLYKALSHHIIESLSLDNRLLLLEYIENDKYNTIEISRDLKQTIFDYYTDKYLSTDKITAIIVPNANHSPPWKILVKSESEGDIIWRDSTKSEILKLTTQIKERVIDYQKNIIKVMSQFVGFMSRFKSDNRMVFKIKNLENKRSTGARCDQAPRETTLQQIKTILQEADISEETISQINDKKKINLCVLQELFLRYFQLKKKNDKVWFITPVEAIILKF